MRVPVVAVMAFELATTKALASERQAPVPPPVAPPAALELTTTTGYARDAVVGGLGVSLGAHLRLDPRWSIGLAVLYEEARTGGSAHALGGEAVSTWHFAPHEFVDPWVSAGLGYRRRTGRADGGEALDASLFDVARLTMGADMRPSSIVTMGPVLGTGVYASGDLVVRPWFFVGIAGRWSLSGAPGD
jgi:hypothetical protein